MNEYELIAYAFEILKGIPIDKRYCVKTFAEIDEKIKKEIRYPGLFIHVENDENLQDYQGITERIYVCDNSLELVPLNDFVLRYLKFGITVSPDEYANLKEKLLQEVYPTLGSVVLVMPLKVLFYYDGTNFNYLAGDYHFTDENQYNALPEEFKTSNKVVYINSSKKIILSDKTLSDPLIDINEIPSNIENDRYYGMNGMLYYGFEGKLYKVGEKVSVFKDTKIIGSQVFKHDLNSTHLYGFLRINSVSQSDVKINPDNESFVVRVDFIPQDSNNAKIINSQNLTGTLYIFSLN